MESWTLYLISLVVLHSLVISLVLLVDAAYCIFYCSLNWLLHLLDVSVCIFVYRWPGRPTLRRGCARAVHGAIAATCCGRGPTGSSLGYRPRTHVTQWYDLWYQPLMQYASEMDHYVSGTLTSYILAQR